MERVKRSSLNKIVLLLALCVGISSGMNDQSAGNSWLYNKWLWAGALGATVAVGWAAYKSFFEKSLPRVNENKIKLSWRDVSLRKSNQDINQSILKGRYTRVWSDRQNKGVWWYRSDNTGYPLTVVFEKNSEEKMVYQPPPELVNRVGILNSIDVGKRRVSMTAFPKDRLLKGNFIIAFRRMKKVPFNKTCDVEDVLNVYEMARRYNQKVTTLVIAMHDPFDISPNVLWFLDTAGFRAKFPDVRTVYIGSLYKAVDFYNRAYAKSDSDIAGIFYLK